MKSSLQLKIKVKAQKKWNKEPVLLNPVFFMFHKGFEWKEVSGYGQYSIFCNGHKDYIFGTWAKVQIWFLWRIFWLRNRFYWRLRYNYPYRFKRWKKSLFEKKQQPDLLPF